MASKKKAKAPAKKKESAPVGRPSELVKLTSRDLTPRMQSFLDSLKSVSGLSGEDVVEAMLQLAYRDTLLYGTRGVANKLLSVLPK